MSERPRERDGKSWGWGEKLEVEGGWLCKAVFHTGVFKVNTRAFEFRVCCVHVS